MALMAFAVFFLGYRYYSRFLAERLFQLSPDYRTPARRYEDSVDFVPTNKFILWGHHFTSVAGAAPIIGPAIAMIWGWGPALAWVLIGTVFMAGIHDFGTLWASVRNRGQSVGVIARNVISPRALMLFLLIIFFLLLMVNAVFAVAIGTLFSTFPESVLPYWLQIPIAITIGVLVYRRNWHILMPSLAGLILLLFLVYAGTLAPLGLPEQMGGYSSTAWWVLIMLGYGAIASRLPVWLLLQPRDFINSHLLFICLALVYMGVFIGQPEIVAPMYNTAVPDDAPPLLPLLFVTIACGAISGFHGLVSSGTSSKQLAHETDARFVGYLGSTGEGLLAVAAILATAAGFATVGDWNEHYGSWAEASSQGIAAFVEGAGNHVNQLGIPVEVATTFMSMMVVAFAATTLDTSMRLQRFILGEIGRQYRMPALGNINFATVLVFLSCAALAFFADPSNPGAGGMVLWPLFGTTNQLTAGLSLLVLTLILWHLKRPIIYSLVPFLFVGVMTIWSMIINIGTYLREGNMLLVVIGGLIFVLNIWLILEGINAVRQKRDPSELLDTDND
ncbi:carbon starvation protein A [Halomonas sp. 22501_18_FS]|uniref:Carbon starvation protein A n=2 Tax=Oceanospirillales TaxID=135619 RepID=A0A9X4YA87_9GAMM|nr:MULTISPECIES: carbon starvation protein A [Halomonas]MYL25741.1 carbon starvation protein A [Halomonas utahensis]MYL75687.1 carbon starvation protein A [Halomonas sp. 22501_18_FS]